MVFTISKHQQDQSELMSLPLELRHKIYEYVNFRGHGKERQIFRTYLDAIAPKSDGFLFPPKFVDEERLGPGAADDDQDSQTTGQIGESEGDEPDSSPLFDPVEFVDEVVRPYAMTMTNMMHGAWLAYMLRRIYCQLPYLLWMSTSPPPTNILLLCQRIHDEATDHFYNTNSLHVDPTTSLRRLSRSKDIRTSMIDPISSPFKWVRRVNIRVVWDSAYLNALAQVVDPTDPDKQSLPPERPALEDMLGWRMQPIARVLSGFPRLSNVKMDFYDSKDGSEEVALQSKMMQPLLTLCCDKHAVLQVEEHKVGEGRRPTKDSIIGRFRAELKQMVEYRHCIW